MIKLTSQPERSPPGVDADVVGVVIGPEPGDIAQGGHFATSDVGGGLDGLIDRQKSGREIYVLARRCGGRAIVITIEGQNILCKRVER